MRYVGSKIIGLSIFPLINFFRWKYGFVFKWYVISFIPLTDLKSIKNNVKSLNDGEFSVSGPLLMIQTQKNQIYRSLFETKKCTP